MKILAFILLSSLLRTAVFSQGLQIKVGDQFPDIPITNLLNAPFGSLQLSKPSVTKVYILNFWGTWCSPCIPEMDSLAKLQIRNSETIQVLGISDEVPTRLSKYLERKPSKIWLASDTSAKFYQMFGFNSVGQSAIINSKGKVVGLVRTDSINQTMINKLMKGQTIKYSAETKERPINSNADIFGVDSTLSQSFTVRSYMIGQQSMGKRYDSKSIFSGRRISFINTSLYTIYTEAFDIVSPKQVVYEIPEKLVSNYDDKQSLYCLDLLIKSGGKDSLYAVLRNKLKEVMPIKARIEMREMPVYALINKNFNQKKSDSTQVSYGFSGKGYEGTGATLANFAHDYLSNEFDLPVVDETGLGGRYDIKTNIEMRTRTDIIKSITQIGLELVKKTKSMPVLLFYKTSKETKISLTDK